MTEKEFLAAIARLEKMLEARRKVIAGKMKVVRVWRRPYRERKIRRYAGHYVERIVPLDYEPKRKGRKR